MPRRRDGYVQVVGRQAVGALVDGKADDWGSDNDSSAASFRLVRRPARTEEVQAYMSKMTALMTMAAGAMGRGRGCGEEPTVNTRGRLGRRLPPHDHV